MMHARSMLVLAERRDGGWRLAAPAPGMFHPSIDPGGSVTTGRSIGTLEILGRPCLLVVPDGVAGYASDLGELRAVQYGEVLVELLPGGVQAATQREVEHAQDVGRVFRAPTSGRFYGRSSPDKPPFVAVGDELASGATVCLLEVMKTFHRVHYSGDTVRVREILVREGDDVNAGDPLLGLDDT